MARPSRYTQKTFGTGAGTNQMSEFGSFAAGTPVRDNGATITPAIVQALSNYTTGWVSAVEANNSPCIEDMNSLCYLFAYQLFYGLTLGVPEWDSGTTYWTGSIVQDGSGNLYTSLTNTNLNNALTSTTNWRKGSGSPTVQTKSSTYQILPGDRFVKVSGTFTATLPDATLNSGLEITLVKTDSNATTTTINTLSAQTISGSSSVILTEQYSFYKMFSDGSNWYLSSAG